MKTKTIASIAALSLIALTGFAQTPPTPPTPPVPPVPPTAPGPPLNARDRDRDRGPKVPVTFLGIETSEVPSVVAEQLGLAKGFGLVVDYVVPDGPAAAAGVQPNDILKMLNDQILMEPDQLAKLIRSYNEGTSVTLTVLRKGAETKLTAKLGKREVPQRRGMENFRRRGGENFGVGPEFQEEMKRMGEEMKNMQFGKIDETVRAAREQARVARDEARRIAQEAQRMAKGVRVMTSNENGALKTTKIDLGKAQIVYSDGAGEMKIDSAGGKKMLIAKDPQGKLLFSGPITSREELDKVPAEVRQRYEKLEQTDLPAVAPRFSKDDDDDDHDMDMDVNDEDDGDDDDNNSGARVINIATPPQSFQYQRLGINTVLI